MYMSKKKDQLTLAFRKGVVARMNRKKCKNPYDRQKEENKFNTFKQGYNSL